MFCTKRLWQENHTLIVFYSNSPYFVVYFKAVNMTSFVADEKTLSSTFSNSHCICRFTFISLLCLGEKATRHISKMSLNACHHGGGHTA